MKSKKDKFYQYHYSLQTILLRPTAKEVISRGIDY